MKRLLDRILRRGVVADEVRLQPDAAEAPVPPEIHTRMTDNDAAPSRGKVRIAVGSCPACGHELRVRAHAVKPVIHLTCRCGRHSEISVGPEILQSPEVTLAIDARKPAPWEDPPEVRLLVASVERLLAIYRERPAGFSRYDDGPFEREIREIGRSVNEAGGFDLMLRAHDSFRRACDIVGAPRNLEILWSGIGEWLG